jgi:peptidoglycan/xylan/chitin deacetylase (PgdA/CDA1 family)
MYHYVRDVERTGWPRIHARSVAEFESQLDALCRDYEPVALADVVAGSIPERALLLTFDDGLVDHRDTVLPALLHRGLSGVFAAPAAATLDRHVVDVQKSQFVLAAADDHLALLGRARAVLEAPASSADERFDASETAELKELLQAGSPEPERRRLLDDLFGELVAADERAFADELYLTLDDLRALRREGMAVAGHGVSHRRLGSLSEEEQRREIEGTVELLRLVHGGDPGGWAMSYPSGSYDATTLSLVAERGCVVGLTVQLGVADEQTPALELPRLDTNDLPLS